MIHNITVGAVQNKCKRPIFAVRNATNAVMAATMVVKTLKGKLIVFLKIKKKVAINRGNRPNITNNEKIRKSFMLFKI